MFKRSHSALTVASAMATCALIIPLTTGAAAQPAADTSAVRDATFHRAASVPRAAQNGRIAFSTGFILVDPDLRARGQVYTVNPDGTRTRQLTHVPRGIDAGDPAWSPDGSRIAYVSNASGNFAVWGMRANGTGQHPIAGRPGFDYFTPQWSPNGRRLVVTECDAALGPPIWCHIVVMGSDGSARRTLVGGRRINQNPDYSPAGRWIAFDSDRAGFHSTVWLVRPDGSALHRLTRPFREAFWPRWSPDGRHLLFTNNCCVARSDVFVMRADGSHIRQLTHFPGLHQGGFASYSPDGRQIVLMSSLKRPGDSPFNDLYTMRADGSNLRRIVSDHQHVALSDWGPAR
jgi:Tol biopolymer transport system component